jgi:tRNA-Thr(GGU) m(6)t(6)A37 methyltransferase TsaA
VTSEIALEPVGVARTPFTSIHDIPRQGGGPARLQVFEPFVPALDGLERCSHVWVVAWFGQAARLVQARTRKAAPGDAPRGVFSMRSPARPNPLGLSVARLLGRSGAVVELDRLDLCDGTPVVDIKPYSPGWDMVPAAASAHRYDPDRYDRPELEEALWRDATNALGEAANGSEVARSIVAALSALVFDARLDVRDPGVRFFVGGPDERVDVLLCATGASFGNRRLLLETGPVEPRVVLRVQDVSGRCWEAVRAGEGSVVLARRA